MSRTRNSDAAEQGFGLVETLIAMTIVATMAALVFQAIALNARTTRMIAERRSAVLVAKSALDLAVVGGGAIDGRRFGVSGAYRWRVTEQRYSGDVGSGPPLDLITVSVSLAKVQKPTVELRTLRLSR